jgi:hypothetical protein
MAQWRLASPLSRITQAFRPGSHRQSRDTGRRIEEKHETLSKATQEWLSLLREMELNGEVTDARYDRYYQAYLQAKQQEKRADLELFNKRQGLSD